MIKQIKYNRNIDKFKAFLSTIEEESYYNGTDYHFGIYGLKKQSNAPYTLYYYDYNYNELRIYPEIIQKMKVHGENYTFDITENDYCNILCDCFFSKHYIQKVTVYICSTTYNENILFEYDKRNKIQ